VLKNRNAELKDRVFMVGVNRKQMRLYDLEEPFRVAEEVNEKRKVIPTKKATASRLLA
jgi:hypothetical protein